MWQMWLRFFLILPGAVLGLEVIAPPSQQALLGSTVLLPCTFQEKNLQIMANFLAIFWYFGDTEILRYDNKGKEIIHSRVTVDEKGFLQGNASITLSNVTISDEGTYRCLVIHSPSRQEKKISFRVQAVPGVRIVKKTLIKKEEGALQCLVTDYYPQSITVTWLLNGKPLTRSAQGTPRQNEDGTFRVNSSVTLLPSETQDNLVIGCQVQHESHPTPLTDSFKMVFGVPPSVRMFSSKVEGHSEKIFVCEASGFSPEPVQIKWLMDGVRVEEPRTSDGGGSIKESYYRVTSGPETQLANITCEAYHETLYQPVTETLQITKNYRHYYGTIVAVLLFPGLLLFWFIFITLKNFLRVRVSPIHKLMSDDGEKLTLHCVASNWPKDPQVTWTVMEGSRTKSKEKRKVIWKETENLKGKGSVPESSTTSGESDALLNEEYSMRTNRLEAGGLHNVLATLSFKPDAQKHENIEVFCQFVCGGKIKERKLQYSYILRQPQVSQPIKLSINETGDLLYSLVLQEFYPRQIQIRWSCGVGCYQDMESNTKIIPCSSIQAFNAESECKIPGQLLKDPGFTVRVTWKHESMTGPEQQELSVRDKEFPWCPQMEEIINPDTLIHSKEGKFQCKIWGYFPDALEVKWLRREAGGQELFSVCPSEKYKIPEMEQKREADGTFSCTVSLIVSVSAITDQGVEFICRVGHPSLNVPLERSTGALSVRVVPVVTNILQKDRHIIMEIDQFYPQNIEVTWHRAKEKQKDYRKIFDVQNKLFPNSDGSYRLTSICEGMDLLDKMNWDDLYFTAQVQHETLNSPMKIEFLREKGVYYLLSEGQKPKPLPNC